MSDEEDQRDSDGLLTGKKVFRQSWRSQKVGAIFANL